MDAPEGFCSFCGEPSDDRHHLTGRDLSGVYLHDKATADLCHRHHELIHNMLRSQRINTVDKTSTGQLSLVGYVLRRLAAFIGQFAVRADNPVWHQIAMVLEACATQLDGMSPIGVA